MTLAFSLAGRSVSVAGIRARITPRNMLGRVSSANSTIAMGVIVLGSLLGGVVATEVSSTAALWLAFAVMMLPAFLPLGHSIKDFAGDCGDSLL